ncbi:hypothetical protein ABW19_dt0209429 [Dactylella cylindrospora]|nr:hypothetical protein ABW19_dt0209429 [Dactylella cylindrospora]
MIENRLHLNNRPGESLLHYIQLIRTVNIRIQPLSFPYRFIRATQAPNFPFIHPLITVQHISSKSFEFGHPHICNNGSYYKPKTKKNIGKEKRLPRPLISHLRQIHPSQTL